MRPQTARSRTASPECDWQRRSFQPTSTFCVNNRLIGFSAVQPGVWYQSVMPLVKHWLSLFSNGKTRFQWAERGLMGRIPVHWDRLCQVLGDLCSACIWEDLHCPQMPALWKRFRLASTGRAARPSASGADSKAPDGYARSAAGRHWAIPVACRQITLLAQTAASEVSGFRQLVRSKRRDLRKRQH